MRLTALYGHGGRDGGLCLFPAFAMRHPRKLSLIHISIVGFSGLLVEPSTDEEERKEYSSIIRNNTDLMLNLVNDVLDLSRMETGDLHFDIKDHLLLVCCQMALESVRHRIPDGVKLTFSPAGEPIVVHVDNLRLQQLLTNAAKFTEKGEINLSFQLEPARKKVCLLYTSIKL